MRRVIYYPLFFVLLVFILPALAHLALWSTQDRPGGWRSADWSSAGILPAPKQNEAAVYVLAARTGGLKGAFAKHSWLVIKKPGVANYDRYDVVGWGPPVRKNAYDPDGRWYSNTPEIAYSIQGDEARSLIPKIEKAILSYRWNRRGDYTLWPGPNSNTFVAGIVRAVPGFDAVLPTTAVGRDFPEDGKWWRTTSSGALRASLGGYVGLVFGQNEGIELNFLGLVAGLNLAKGEAKIPAFGTFSW